MPESIVSNYAQLDFTSFKKYLKTYSWKHHRMLIIPKIALHTLHCHWDSGQKFLICQIVNLSYNQFASEDAKRAVRLYLWKSYFFKFSHFLHSSNPPQIWHNWSRATHIFLKYSACVTNWHLHHALRVPVHLKFGF